MTLPCAVANACSSVDQRFAHNCAEKAMPLLVVVSNNNIIFELTKT